MDIKLNKWGKEWDKLFGYASKTELEEFIGRLLINCEIEVKKETRLQTLEEVERVILTRRMLNADKIWFNIFGGKADEDEKLFIYNQAFKDILQTINKMKE